MQKNNNEAQRGSSIKGKRGSAMSQNRIGKPLSTDTRIFLDVQNHPEFAEIETSQLACRKCLVKTSLWLSAGLNTCSQRGLQTHKKAGQVVA